MEKILIVDSKFVYDTYDKIQDTPVSQVETQGGEKPASFDNIQEVMS